MRFNKDYGEISRRSIRQEMQHQRHTYHPRRNGNIVRIVALNETSWYWKYRYCIVNRLFRIVDESVCGKEVEFINEDDRKNLNRAAGWSDNKKTYIIDGAKYD